jgi:hypothetical protein
MEFFTRFFGGKKNKTEEPGYEEDAYDEPPVEPRALTPDEEKRQAVGSRLAEIDSLIKSTAQDQVAIIRDLQNERYRLQTYMEMPQEEIERYRKGVIELTPEEIGRMTTPNGSGQISEHADRKFLRLDQRVVVFLPFVGHLKSYVAAFDPLRAPTDAGFIAVRSVTNLKVYDGSDTLHVDSDNSERPNTVSLVQQVAVQKDPNIKVQ